MGLEETLQGQKDLRRPDRLDQVVVDSLPDRLVHQRLGFVLGHEHDRNEGIPLLDRLQRGEAAQAGHRLVQQHHVELLPRRAGHRVGAVRDGGDVIALGFEKEDMRLQEVDLIIGPEDFSVLGGHGSWVRDRA